MTEQLFNHLNEKHKFNDREQKIVHDVIAFVLDKDNWGISFKTHILLQMLKSLGVTEPEIIHFLIDENI